MQTSRNDGEPEGTPTSENIQALVNRWIAAFNAHDVERIVALYSEDAELFDTGMKSVRKGQAEIRRWFTSRFQQMPTLQYNPIRFFFSEEEASVGWIAKGHTPPLLRQRWLVRPFEVDGVSVFQVWSGLICWQRGYYDHLGIVERVLPPLKWLPLRL